VRKPGGQLELPALPSVSALEMHVAENAACRGMTDLFLADEPSMAKCRSVCDSCPVRTECRRVVDRLEGDSVVLAGVWAGEDFVQRAQRRAGQWRRRDAA